MQKPMVCAGSSALTHRKGLAMDASFDSHVDEESLERYALGRLSQKEAEVADEHLLLCEPCQQRLEAMDEYVEALKRASAELMTDRPSRTELFRARLLFVPMRWKLALATGLASLALVGVLVPQRTEVRGSPFAVLLQATRGVQDPAGARAPAGRPLELKLDLTGLEPLAACRVEIVDGDGVLKWSAQGKPEQGILSVAAPGNLPQGQYWIRVYDPAPGADLRREFGLLLE